MKKNKKTSSSYPVYIESLTININIDKVMVDKVEVDKISFNDVEIDKLDLDKCELDETEFDELKIDKLDLDKFEIDKIGAKVNLSDLDLTPFIMILKKFLPTMLNKMLNPPKTGPKD